MYVFVFERTMRISVIILHAIILEVGLGPVRGTLCWMVGVTESSEITALSP